MMTPLLLARRRFDLADQVHFAALSGDANPMHVDPIAARRTQFGEVVVHGVHGLLWALDEAAAQCEIGARHGVVAQFPKPILLGDEVEAYLIAVEPDIRIELRVQQLPCTIIKVSRDAPRMPPTWPAAPVRAPLRTLPREIAVDDFPDARGALDYSAPSLAAAFPALARDLGLSVVEGLAAATYIVGMEAPGLHSIFTKLSAAIEPHAASGSVDFKVAMADSRFRIVEIHMQSRAVRAKLNAFARVPPVAPPGMADAAMLVRRDEFAGQRAFIAGGSRGLGAATAKLIAAGGGEVFITYARGAAEAAAVAADITAGGGNCETLLYDASRPPGEQIDLPALAPNAIYYFATGPIWRRKTQHFDPKVMREFMQVHVEGFAALAEAARAATQGRLALLYPSSIYAAEAPRDLGEYGAAKRAGEAIAENLAAAFSDTLIVVERLPAIATDQNASVTPVKTLSPIEAMLPLVRRMHAGLQDQP